MQKACGLHSLQATLELNERRLRNLTQTRTSGAKLRAFKLKRSLSEVSSRLVRAKARSLIRKHMKLKKKQVRHDQGVNNSREKKEVKSFPEKVASEKAVNFLVMMRNDIYLRRLNFELEKERYEKASLSTAIAKERVRMKKRMKEFCDDLDSEKMSDIHGACDEFYEELLEELDILLEQERESYLAEVVDPNRRKRVKPR